MEAQPCPDLFLSLVTGCAGRVEPQAQLGVVSCVLYPGADLP